MTRNFEKEIESYKIKQFSFLEQIEFLESLISLQGHIESRNVYLKKRINYLNLEVSKIDVSLMELIRLKSEEIYHNESKDKFKVPAVKKVFYQEASKYIKKRNSRKCIHCGYCSRSEQGQSSHELRCQVVYEKPCLICHL